MQNSFGRDRGRDLGFNKPQDSGNFVPDCSKSMVLAMNNETYQTNGHDNDGYNKLSSGSSGMAKKTMPANGKKTKGRVKIKMEFIDNKLRRYTTFSKRKTGIMKKAYELSTLTGTQVMLLVASETGHVYTFATRKLQPMITSEAGKGLIQTCLNSPDPPPGPGTSSLDQRMSAQGFQETDITYSVTDDCDKLSDNKTVYTSELSPTSLTPSSTLLTPSLVSFAPSLTTSTCVTTSKPLSVSTSSPSSIISSNLSSATSSSLPSGFTTILTAPTTGSEGSPTVQLGAFQSPDSPLSQDGQRASPQQAVYGLPTGQPFSLTIAGDIGGTKGQIIPATSDSSTSQSAISVVPGSSQNLSVVSGNVVIPHTILQPNNGALVYHAGQGLVYATSANLPEGVVLNLGQQEQTGTQQQFITIPVSLSLTPAQQQQLIQGTQSTSQTPSFSTSSGRKDKSRK